MGVVAAAMGGGDARAATPPAHSVSQTVGFTDGLQTFEFTGGLQTFVVPAGVTALTVKAVGGQGGSGAVAPGQPSIGAGVGGWSAIATTTISVSPGESLTVVGGDGVPGVAGFNGGGAPGSPYAGGGGGASDVRTSADPSTRLVVAAGGGGAPQSLGYTAFSGGPGEELGAGGNADAGAPVENGLAPSTSGGAGALGTGGAGGAAVTVAAMAGLAGDSATGGAGGAGSTSGGGGGGGGYGGGGGGGGGAPDPKALYVGPGPPLVIGAGGGGGGSYAAGGTVSLDLPALNGGSVFTVLPPEVVIDYTPPVPLSSPPPPAASKSTLDAVRLTHHRSELAATIGCTGNAACHGTLVGIGRTGGRAPRLVTLASGQVTLRANTTRTVELPLTAAGRRLLRRQRAVPSVVVLDGASPREVLARRTVVL